jgi:hypothetical protein
MTQSRVAVFISGLAVASSIAFVVLGVWPSLPQSGNCTQTFQQDLLVHMGQDRLLLALGAALAAASAYWAMTDSQVWLGQNWKRVLVCGFGGFVWLLFLFWLDEKQGLEQATDCLREGLLNAANAPLGLISLSGNFIPFIRDLAIASAVDAAIVMALTMAVTPFAIYQHRRRQAEAVWETNT